MARENFLTLFLKGMAIGAANVIPGVSGGTLAVVLNIYERLTETIGSLAGDFCNKEKRKRHLAFLVPILSGGVVSIALSAKAISWIFLHYSGPAQLFFVGLIIGTAPLLARSGSLSRVTFGKGLAFALGAALMAAFWFLERYFGADSAQAAAALPAVSGVYLAKLFLSGFLAAAAMVIPGISGSLLLMIIGEYRHVIGFINSFFGSLFNFQGLFYGAPSLAASFIALTVMALGIILGIVLCAKAISWLLKHYKEKTFAFLLGLLLASVASIWPAFALIEPFLLASAVCFAAGFFLAAFFGSRQR